MAKPRYIIDFEQQMADCDANYLKIMKLLPDYATVDEMEFALPSERGETLKVVITVIDRARYTTTVMVRQEVTAAPWSGPQMMNVRIYHDAQMAEIISFQKKRHFHARYEYPNDQQFHPDEKAQLNRFLGEWLTYSLINGLSTATFDPSKSEKCDSNTGVSH